MIRVISGLKSVGVPVARAVATGDAVTAHLARERITHSDWTTHDYNVHFLLSLANDGTAERAVEISVEGGVFDDLPKIAPLLYTAASIDGPWDRADLSARTDGKTRYAIRASISPGTELHVANTLPRSLEDINRETERAGSAAAGRTIRYGTSLDGHPLVAIDVGDPDATPVLVTSGFHPPEPDTLATVAILDWLATPEGRQATAGFRIIVVPVANPDGYARATQGSNSSGINIYWHFDRNDPEKSPEAAALWKLANDVRPRGYIDFHAYTLQTRKKPGPYVRPLRYYQAPSIREAAATLYRSFSGRPEIHPVTGFPTFAPTTLGTLLSRTFQTLTLAKYHVHLKNGPEEIRRHGVEVLAGMLSALTAAGVSGPALDRGYRSRRLDFAEFWYGFFRPRFGLLIRGRLREIRLTRFELIDP